MRTCTLSVSSGLSRRIVAECRPSPGICRTRRWRHRAPRSSRSGICTRCWRKPEIEGKEEVLAALDRNYATYVVNVDAAPAAAVCAGSREAQPQTFLMAPSMSVRVVAMESSTPVNTGG